SDRRSGGRARLRARDRGASPRRKSRRSSPCSSFPRSVSVCSQSKPLPGLGLRSTHEITENPLARVEAAYKLHTPSRESTRAARLSFLCSLGAPKRAIAHGKRRRSFGSSSFFDKETLVGSVREREKVRPSGWAAIEAISRVKPSQLITLR